MTLEPFIIEWKKQQEKERQRQEESRRIWLPLPLPSAPQYDNNDNPPADDRGITYIPLHNDDLSSSYKV